MRILVLTAAWTALAAVSAAPLEAQVNRQYSSETQTRSSSSRSFSAATVTEIGARQAQPSSPGDAAFDVRGGIPPGMRPIPPTYICGRDVNDPPGSGCPESRSGVSSSKSKSKKKAVGRSSGKSRVSRAKTPRAKAAPAAPAPGTAPVPAPSIPNPCPPGCQPIDTSMPPGAAPSQIPRQPSSKRVRPAQIQQAPSTGQPSAPAAAQQPPTGQQSQSAPPPPDQQGPPPPVIGR